MFSDSRILYFLKEYDIGVIVTIIPNFVDWKKTIKNVIRSRVGCFKRNLKVTIETEARSFHVLGTNSRSLFSDIWEEVENTNSFRADVSWNTFILSAKTVSFIFIREE